MGGLSGQAGGTWEFSHGGRAWEAAGVVSKKSALLLAATDRVRFVPTAGFNGSAELRFLAWDQTRGADQAGRRVTPRKLGDAISVEELTAIAWVNQAPVFGA